MTVTNFLIIPKHYFIPDFIERRNPLSQSARRAGWVGCNILLNQIPKSGRLFLVKNSVIIDKSKIVEQWDKTKFLRKIKLKSKGWLIDILSCIDLIEEKEFTLEQVYKFEIELQHKYPKNKFIKDKIRQQLQVLRDKGIIEFVSRGLYRKL